MWNPRIPRFQAPFLTGRLSYRDRRGPMVLVAADPKTYAEKGRFDPPDRSAYDAWAAPSGRLYLRDQDVLLC